MFDILIKNGIIFDGTGKGSGVRTDIGIKGDTITAIRDLPGSGAHELIDANGFYVAPGFVDIQNHSDSHGMILNHTGLDSLVAQGVTTVVIGQCGASLAPLPDSSSIKSLQKWGLIEGLNADWQTYGEFVKRLSSSVFGANVASFVGHATLRRHFTGDISRTLNQVEIRQLANLLRDSLKEGAFGISFGFQYGHEIKTAPEEVFALMAVTKEYNRIFSAHMRSQDADFVNALQEVLEYGGSFNVKTKISHFKVEGKENLKFLSQGINMIESAYQKGTQVCFDVYPYTTTWRSLYTYLPNWAYEGGFKPMLERIKNKEQSKRMLVQLSERRDKLGMLLVTTSPRVNNFIGKTVAEISRSQSRTPEEAILAILSANRGQAIVFDHDVDPSEVTVLMKHPFSFIGSDGIGYPFKKIQMEELPHPRCFGAFPRFLRMLRQDNVPDNSLPLMSWAEGIAKISGRPASFIGLKNRGLLRKEFKADVVVFDPALVSDAATYANPFQPPIGLKYVINNGKISVYDGQITGVHGGRLLTT